MFEQFFGDNKLKCSTTVRMTNRSKILLIPIQYVALLQLLFIRKIRVLVTASLKIILNSNFELKKLEINLK